MREKDKRSLHFVKMILRIIFNNLKDCDGSKWNSYYEELYKYLCDEIESRWNR
jgi:hypothetical protein